MPTPSGSVTVPESALDFSQYGSLGLSASTTVDIGDYLVLYNTENLSNDPAYISYGVVTGVSVSSAGVRLDFEATTAEAMQSAKDYSSASQAVSGQAMLSDTNVIEAQSEIQAQISESGFIADVMPYAFSIVEQTPTFQATVGNSEYIVEYAAVNDVNQ